MIPDHLVDAYQELQQEKGREEITFDQAQEEAEHLTELLLSVIRYQDERGGFTGLDDRDQ